MQSVQIIAIILNVATFLLIIALIILNSGNLDEGSPGEFLIVCAVLVFLGINIIVLLSSGPSWLGRLFERKKLEELIRIKSLQKELENNKDSN